MTHAEQMDRFGKGSMAIDRIQGKTWFQKTIILARENGCKRPWHVVMGYKQKILDGDYPRNENLSLLEQASKLAALDYGKHNFLYGEILDMARALNPRLYSDLVETVEYIDPTTFEYEAGRVPISVMVGGEHVGFAREEAYEITSIFWDIPQVQDDSGVFVDSLFTLESTIANRSISDLHSLAFEVARAFKTPSNND